VTAVILSILLCLRGLGVPFEVQAMTVTMYTNAEGAYPYQGLMASGEYTRPGAAACGQTLFDARAHVYIEGIGWVQCLDRGGAIGEDDVDVWTDDLQAAKEWGVRQMLVVVVR
jgi:3D (Asp-Asp-Asp) domain-containing protein